MPASPHPVAPALRSLLLVDASPLPVMPHAPDAVILDLAGCRDIAPGALAPLLAAARRGARYRVLVRLSPLAVGCMEAELAAVLPEQPDGVLLAGCAGAPELQGCGVKLGVVEAEHGWPAGAIAILAAPDAMGVLALAGFTRASPRLCGILADAEAAGVAAPGEAGDVMRTLVRLGAQAAGVPAYRVGEPGDIRRHGFAGVLTRDPAAIAALNAGG